MLVIVLLAIISIIAIPKFINLSQNARIAVIKNLAATVSADANMSSNKCALTPGCFGDNVTWLLTIGSGNYQMWNGYPDAGDNIGTNEIDVMVNAPSQFTISIIPPLYTIWQLNSAPDPTNCAVRYQEATSTQNVPVVTTLTTGC